MLIMLFLYCLSKTRLSCCQEIIIILFRILLNINEISLNTLLLSSSVNGEKYKCSYLRPEKLGSQKLNYYISRLFSSAYSLFFVSMHIVTGPSLSNSTFIIAPNSPVPIDLPIASVMSSQKRL